MAFDNDGGGFCFSCEDAKICIGSSTWSTRLSQIKTKTGPILIMTNLLPDIEYISGIIEKRPCDISIIANETARNEAVNLKSRFPLIEIYLHKNNNAKVVLVSPDTVWISSCDFGKEETKKFGSTVGFHSTDVYENTKRLLFDKILHESQKI